MVRQNYIQTGVMSMKSLIMLLLAVLSLGTILVSSCGEAASIQDELAMIPGLCFLHIHISENLDIDLIPEAAGEFLPLWLCDSLIARGSFGVSLLGINLTDFTPQLLFLSKELGTNEMLELGKAGFHCGTEENQQGYNLIDERGSMMGSIAGRDGWTCLITGSGSDRSARRWLELEKEESLAADSDLVSISGSDADLTVLVSHNSIAFISVIPTGMLSRSQIAILNRVKNLISAINPKALRVSLSISDEEPPVTVLELQLVREGSNVTSFSVSFSDTDMELIPTKLIRDGGILF